jgi:hypothetical protein
MKLVMHNICTPSLVAVLLVSLPTTAQAGIKPIHERDAISLTDFRPPILHTNQGGRSHGGDTMLITPGLNAWKPFVLPSPLPDTDRGLSMTELIISLASDTAVAYSSPTVIAGVNNTFTPDFNATGPTSSSDAPASLSSPVPAPGALTLLLCAGLRAGRRRRRTG